MEFSFQHWWFQNKTFSSFSSLFSNLPLKKYTYIFYTICTFKLFLSTTTAPKAGLSWIKVPGSLSSVSVGQAGVWGAVSTGDIFHRQGTYDEVGSGHTWVKTSK